MYDEKTCTIYEAAWLVVGGNEVMFFEAHVTEDHESPTGTGWYFASYAKQLNGEWEEREGGIYWDYVSATELECVISETVPFETFDTHRIDHSAFEEICFNGDEEAEQKLFRDVGVPVADAPKTKPFSVRIIETLERTVEVDATSRSDALEQVASEYRKETHVLDSGDFKGVDFKIKPTERSRGTR